MTLTPALALAMVPLAFVRAAKGEEYGKSPDQASCILYPPEGIETCVMVEGGSSDDGPRGVPIMSVVPVGRE